MKTPEDSSPAKEAGKTWDCSRCGEKQPQSITTCPNDGQRQIQTFCPGDVIFGPYQYLETIGTGGMGVVYKAKHVLLDKTVAIKMMHAHTLTDEALMRFQREGKVTSRLNHPNIIAVYDLGLTDSGQPFLVMDYLSGHTLAEELSKQGRLRIDVCRQIFEQICDALTHAHDMGVIHRDLKPSNIMLVQRDGKIFAQVLDFGIAKLLNPDDLPESKLTQTGQSMGTPLYMSPEQCRGLAVDKRSDIYALGCLMYECLTGSPPHLADSALDVMFKHINDQPLPLAEASLGIEFPSDLEIVVLKAMSKNPNDRFSNANELKSALANSLELQNASTNTTIRTTLKNMGFIKSPKAKLFLAIASISLLIGLPLALLLTGQSNLDSLQEVNHATVSAKSTRKKDTRSQALAEQESIIGKLPDVPSLLLDPENETSLTANKRLEKLIREQSVNVTHLDLQEVHIFNIDDNGLKVLTRLKNLKELRVKKTKIKGEGLMYLVGLPLIILDVNRTAVSDGGLKTIGKITTLLNLDVSGTDVTDQGLKYVLKPPLHAAWLNNTAITNKGMRVIGKHRSLKVLHIAGTNVDDYGVHQLKNLPLLFDLNLNGTKITDESLKTLGKMKSLQTVDLSRTAISDVGLQHLAKLSSLRTLRIAQTRSTPNGIRALGQALPLCRIITN